MGHGGAGKSSEGRQQVRSKSMKERGKGKQSANSKKQAKGKECGRRAVSISSSNKPNYIGWDVQVRLVDCMRKNNRRRPRPLTGGDTAEPKPK